MTEHGGYLYSGVQTLLSRSNCVMLTYIITHNSHLSPGTMSRTTGLASVIRSAVTANPRGRGAMGPASTTGSGTDQRSTVNQTTTVRHVPTMRKMADLQGSPEKTGTTRRVAAASVSFAKEVSLSLLPSFDSSSSGDPLANYIAIEFNIVLIDNVTYRHIPAKVRVLRVLNLPYLVSDTQI